MRNNVSNGYTETISASIVNYLFALQRIASALLNTLLVTT